MSITSELADAAPKEAAHDSGFRSGNGYFHRLLREHAQAYADADAQNDDNEKNRIVGIIVDSILSDEKKYVSLQWVIHSDPIVVKNLVEKYLAIISMHVHLSQSEATLKPMDTPSDQSSPCCRKNIGCEWTTNGKGCKKDELRKSEQKLRSAPPDANVCQLHSMITKEFITRYDVLCSGKYGDGIFKNRGIVGNVRFRVIIAVHRERFQRANRREKHQLVLSIIEDLQHQSPRMRFLAQDTTSGLWGEVDKRTAFKAIVRTFCEYDPLTEQLGLKVMNTLSKKKAKKRSSSENSFEDDKAQTQRKKKRRQSGMAA